MSRWSVNKRIAFFMFIGFISILWAMNIILWFTLKYDAGALITTVVMLVITILGIIGIIKSDDQ